MKRARLQEFIPDSRGRGFLDLRLCAERTNATMNHRPMPLTLSVKIENRLMNWLSGRGKVGACQAGLQTKALAAHEHWTIRRDLRPDPPRTPGAGARGAGALQSLAHSVCAGRRSATQAAPAAIGLLASLRDDRFGDGARKRLCAFAA